MDWYRTESWDLQAQEHFELKLSRARPWNRPQYLRIKGLALKEAGEVEAARSLFVRSIVASGSDAEESAFTLECLGDTLRSDDPGTAERLYRRSLDINPTLNGTSHQVEVHLAELLIRRGTPEALGEARGLLETWEARFGGARFPFELFMRAVVWARWNDADGHAAKAQQWAQQALEVAQLESPLARVPGLAVTDLDDDLRAWLASVAAGSQGPSDAPCRCCGAVGQDASDGDR